MRQQISDTLGWMVYGTYGALDLWPFRTYGTWMDSDTTGFKAHFEALDQALVHAQMQSARSTLALKVWHDFFMCDTTYSCVTPHTFIFATTHPCVWHTYVMAFHMREMNMKNDTQMCDTHRFQNWHTCVWHTGVCQRVSCHVSSGIVLHMYEINIIHTWDLTHSYVRHDSWIFANPIRLAQKMRLYVCVGLGVYACVCGWCASMCVWVYGPLCVCVTAPLCVCGCMRVCVAVCVSPTMRAQNIFFAGSFPKISHQLLPEIWNGFGKEDVEIFWFCWYKNQKLCVKTHFPLPLSQKSNVINCLFRLIPFYRVLNPLITHSRRAHLRKDTYTEKASYGSCARRVGAVEGGG